MYQIDTDFDVAVIGGGVAGQSAALILGRAHVSVCVIDDAEAAVYRGESHNFLTNDGKTKAAILAKGAAELARYPAVAQRQGRVAGIEKDALGYTLILAGGEEITVARVILAMGYRYSAGALGIDGFDERFGQDVFTCPYCHGFEYTGRHIAMIGSNPRDGHFLRLLSNWSAQITYIRHDGPDASGESFSDLPRARVANARAARIEGALGAPFVVLEDGARVAADVIFIADLPGDNTWPLIDALGIARGLHPITGKPVCKTDPTGRTDLRDVFVIGDARTGFSTLAGAAHEGMIAGFMLANDVIEARARSAAPARIAV
jgi:thioredoxin reductase